jgi:hypothetical protein
MSIFTKIKTFFKKQPETAAAKNERVYRAWLAQNLPSYATDRAELILCYTDRNGNNFYQYANLMQMPQERAVKLDIASQAALYGLDSDFLNTLAENGIDFLQSDSDQAKKDKLWYDLHELQNRLKESNVQRLYVHLGALLFLIDHEDPYTVNDLTTARKIEMAATDDDLRAFFLHIAYAFTRTSKTENDSSTATLWAEEAVRKALDTHDTNTPK